MSDVFISLIVSEGRILASYVHYQLQETANLPNNGNHFVVPSCDCYEIAPSDRLVGLLQMQSTNGLVHVSTETA